MKTLVTPILLAACVIATPASAQTLHPADRSDIKQEAEFAVRQMTIRSGEPLPDQRGGYMVPVMVATTSCKVLVRPYTPKSANEPPARWKADTPACGK